MTKLYPDLNPHELEPHFARHMLAMTAEDLHEKSAIAEQLAWRDQRLEALGKLNEKHRTLDAAFSANVSELLRADQVIGELTSKVADLERSNASLRSRCELMAEKLAAAEERIAEDKRAARCLQCDAHVTEVYECSNGHVFPMHYLEKQS